MSYSKERVVDAAAQLFLGGSFHKTGIAEICAVAHVNKGTFYHFFASKLDLLLEVIERYAADVEQQFAQVAGSAASPREKVVAVFGVPRGRNAAWKEAYGVSSGCFIGNIILEMAASEPAVRARAQAAMTRMTNALQPIVADFLDAANNPGVDVAAAADMLMGLIQGAQVQAKVQNDPAIFDRYAVLAPAMLATLAGDREAA